MNNKMNNKKLFIFGFGFLMLILMSGVSALGVTPARTTIDFEPGLEREVKFEVINSDKKDIDIVMVPDGELAEYIQISESKSSIPSDIKTREFSYTLNLPGDLEPGLHIGEVIILQVPSSSGSSGAQVFATLAVVTQIYVYVPFPGKYANADLIIYNANQGEAVRFVFPIVSAGEFDLTSVWANVEIFNKLDEVVGSFNTGTIEVPSGEKREIVYDWVADVAIGEYRAVASLVYDEGTINLEKIFSVGSLELELESIRVSDFSLGEIAKLEMLVENKWSEPISGAYIETKIKDDDGIIVSAFESVSYEVAALSKKVFVSYWDTAGVKEGTYEADVTINYAGKVSNNNLRFEVSENDLTIIGLGYVISDSGSGEELDTIIVVLIIVVVLLVLINLLWFLKLRKRFK
ncbi:MAG: hypothetical protein IH845_03235 [Nanoarchaeota archaeon]|nr:hypothetical protein [Nanoarchaeota archaeon]